MVKRSKREEKKEISDRPVGTESVHIPSVGDRLVFQVLQYPDKRLRQRSFEIKESDITKEFLGYVDILKNTLFAEGGVGIAAPQVGWNKKIIIVLGKLFLGGGEKEPTVIFNPTLSDLSGEQDSEEACFPVTIHWYIAASSP